MTTLYQLHTAFKYKTHDILQCEDITNDKMRAKQRQDAHYAVEQIDTMLK